MQCRTARRLSGIALFKIILPLLCPEQSGGHFKSSRPAIAAQRCCGAGVCFPRRAFSRGAGLMPFAKCIAAVDVLFCHQKRTRKVRRCPQGMKAPVGLLSRRPVCAANAACSARQGHSDFDALDPRTRGCSPLVTPKRKSNRKKSSRFAQTGCGAQRPLRALSGTRVLLTAAPTAPPCIRRWRRSSPLHFFLGSPFAAPQPLRRQLPQGGAGTAGTRNFALEPETLPSPLKPSPSRGKVAATKGSRRMRVQDSSRCISGSRLAPEPSPSSLRDATSPEGEVLLYLPEDAKKAPPFGGAGCEHSEQTERVLPADCPALLYLK